ncbi:polyprenyl synthetase family protein [Pseudomonas sp. PB3P13]
MTMNSGSGIDNGFVEHLAALRAAIDCRLQQLLPEGGNDSNLITQAMRESTLAPGKRMRPILLLLAAEGLGHQGNQALDLGCAVEMVHAASLVLDDMPCMDDARLRRGRPTIHLQFGQDVAILTAVALLSRAFGIVAAIQGLAPDIRTQLVEVMANAVGTQGLVLGQFQDLRDGQKSRGAEEIALTNSLKTGVLFGAIMDMAWLVGSADPQMRPGLQHFAMELGQAFQLYDDLQDKCVDNHKDQGKDKGKSTFVSLYGERRVTERLRAHLANAEQHLHQVYGSSPTIGSYMKMIFRNVTVNR